MGLFNVLWVGLVCMHNILRPLVCEGHWAISNSVSLYIHTNVSLQIGLNYTHTQQISYAWMLVAQSKSIIAAGRGHCTESRKMGAIPGNHPDRPFSQYIIGCFRIGFNWRLSIKSAPSNMGSAQQHPHIIKKYLNKELSLGHMLGLFITTTGLSKLHVSHFGAIAKGHNAGK